MVVSFRATSVQAYDVGGHYRVSLGGLDRGPGLDFEYVVFLRTHDSHATKYVSRPTPEGYVTEARKCETWQNVYIERKGQNWATHGVILTVELRRDRLLVRVTEQTAKELGGASEFHIALDLDRGRFEQLRDGLRIVLRGLSCLVENVAEPATPTDRLPD